MIRSTSSFAVTEGVELSVNGGVDAGHGSARVRAEVESYEGNALMGRRIDVGPLNVLEVHQEEGQVDVNSVFWSLIEDVRGNGNIEKIVLPAGYLGACLEFIANHNDVDNLLLGRVLNGVMVENAMNEGEALYELRSGEAYDAELSLSLIHSLERIVIEREVLELDELGGILFIVKLVRENSDESADVCLAELRVLLAACGRDGMKHEDLNDVRCYLMEIEAMGLSGEAESLAQQIQATNRVLFEARRADVVRQIRAYDAERVARARAAQEVEESETMAVEVVEEPEGVIEGSSHDECCYWGAMIATAASGFWAIGYLAGRATGMAPDLPPPPLIPPIRPF